MIRRGRFAVTTEMEMDLVLSGIVSQCDDLRMYRDRLAGVTIYEGISALFDQVGDHEVACYVLRAELKHDKQVEEFDDGLGPRLVLTSSYVLRWLRLAGDEIPWWAEPDRSTFVEARS